MPELPEVETIRKELEPALAGRCITRATVLQDRAVREPGVEQFRRELAGRRIERLRRRGKYLIIELSAALQALCRQPGNTGEASPARDRPRALVVHLKLTGGLLLDPPPPHRYGKVLLELDNGRTLLFMDPRGFGRMWLVDDPATLTAGLGPEPLTPDFTVETLRRVLEGRRAPIKAVLLEQDLIAGIGNMYADEALFAARIHPETRSGALSRSEVRRLWGSIRQVLADGIRSMGATTRDYIRPDGSRGTAQDGFNVAHRRGAVCRICGAPIKRIVVRNRGTYFCPNCQRMNT